MSIRLPLLLSTLAFVLAPDLLVTRSATNADYDGSGIVDFRDFVVFAQAFGRQTGQQGYSAACDFDGSGKVDFPDFVAFALLFGETVPTGPGVGDATAGTPPVDARASQGFTIPPRTAMAKIYANPRNLAEKMTELVPGSMLLLEGGDYHLAEPLRITNRIGTAALPMVIRPRGWDESADALISASDRVTFSGRAIQLLNCRYLAIQGIVFETDIAQDHRVIYMNRCSYCRITQCSFLPVETNMPTSEWASWIYCKQLDDYGYNQFDRNAFGVKRRNGECIMSTGYSYLDQGVKKYGCSRNDLIEANYFSGAVAEHKNISFVLVSGAGAPGVGAIVRDNFFEGWDVSAVSDLEVIKCGGGGVTFSHNLFKNCRGGLSLRMGDGCEVKDNIFYWDLPPSTLNYDQCVGVKVHGSGHNIHHNHFFNTYWGIHVCSGNGVAHSDGNCFGVEPVGLHPKVNGCTIQHNRIQATRHHVLYGGYPGRETPYGDHDLQPDGIIDQHNHYYGARNRRGLLIGFPAPTWFAGTRPGVFNDVWDDAVNHIDETTRDVWFRGDLDNFGDIKKSAGVRVREAK